MEKAVKYDKLERQGVSAESLDALRHERDEAVEAKGKLAILEEMFEEGWPNLGKAKRAIVAADGKMTPEEKKDVLSALRKKPYERIADLSSFLKYAGLCKYIGSTLKSDVIMAACESITDDFKKAGFDIMKSSAALAENFALSFNDAASTLATTAICIAFGYADGANTMAESSGGGGGNNDLPKKNDDEDWKKFFGRCLTAAARILSPKKGIKRS